MYEIKTKDTYDNFSKDKNMFDFSNFSAKSKYDVSTKQVVSTLKDETAGATIKQFVGLKKRCVHSR